ncbi:MAG: PAS domain-containing protein [Thermoleophilia bacterium]|nr:PAS domain-containing protein [Thermoleophilia bacterium]
MATGRRNTARALRQDDSGPEPAARPVVALHQLAPETDSAVEFRSGEALMAFDADLRVTAWNEAAESLTGVAAADVVGRFCWEVLCATDERGGIECHAGCSNARLAREGWPVPTRELWIRAGNGRKRVSITTIAVRGGEEPQFLHLMRNGQDTAGTPDQPGRSAPPPLTARQREILGLLADGVPAKVIASRLHLSETTIRNHIRGILTQLASHSQLEAVAKARRLGILDA